MLPAVISREIEQGIKSFLRTTFPSSTPAFGRTLESLLDNPGSVFKGPYYQLRLPFRPNPSERLPFEHIQFPYPRPHLHQARAFSRLCQDPPLSTLVATGTGSGKTECFLYPILEHCAARSAEPGIKAIVIYPMNALATDQARRMAKAIHAGDALRDKVTAGLFIGGESDQSTGMTPDWVITHKDQMREHPPDILLTNYKMLDFLLLRPEEQRLWRDNGPHTLRYLVVDELHSFDGAQSTDLACLIRRLKARLRTPGNHLACAGTSATLGSNNAYGPLIEYARTVFSEPFDKDSVIGEDLLDLADVVEGHFIRYHGIPDPTDSDMDAENAQGDPEEFLGRQYNLWFDSPPPPDFMDLNGRLSLGERLREHSFFRNLLLLIERSGHRVLSEDWLLHGLGQMDSRLEEPAKSKRVLDSFLSLCAHSRYRSPESGSTGPLVWLRVHLWTRELSRMVASVEPIPMLAFSDDLSARDTAENKRTSHLPVIHCRECGAMGWGGTMRANAEKVSPGLQEFYRAFFGKTPSLRFFFPEDPKDHPGQKEFTRTLCGDCLAINGPNVSKCSHCGRTERLVSVLIHDRSHRHDDHTEADVACPFCESATGLSILGSRSASLTSVALGQLYASPFNQDKRALAFSDNVQDASHRAGFFAARTYRVNLRTAICRYIRKHEKELEKELGLADLEKRFLDYWKEQLGDEDFAGLFLAPNMEWLHDYDTLKTEGKLPPDSNLVSLVSRRTAWEIISEFGFTSRIGRTLEKSGAAIAYPIPERLSQAVSDLQVSLKEKAGGLGSIQGSEVHRLLTGLMHRLRTRGGIDHVELEDYIQQGGNTYPLTRRPHMPQFSDRLRAPSFFCHGPNRFKRFERIVATGTSLSWCQRWVMKTLTRINPESAGATEIVLEEAVKALVSARVLAERPIRDSRIWCIPTDALLVTCEVRVMTCRQCGHSISCAPAEEAAWTEAPCVRPACHGAYRKDPAVEDYFGDLYRSGDILRIRSAEHTGLLKRDVREWVEKRFMAQPPERRLTDPNLLSCTPTLEMGVNIGDLSTVLLCTVPPASANYVQRVGRAGRSEDAEGVAFSLTIAAARPHDLYYYEAPQDMIAGEILPPGTFLDAPAVLERQLTAYCLDRWSQQSDPRPVLPHKLSPVLDAVANPEKYSGFPHDFFTFIETNLEALISAFLDLFHADELSDDSRDSLIRFAKGDLVGGSGLTNKILTRLRGVERERHDLRDRLRKIGSAIRRNKRITARDEALEEELDALKQHRNGINGMLKQINDKLTLNFLTDEGLLPNYMFPEEAVELRSVILRERKRRDENEGKFEALSFDYVRPAAAAITELAPGNVFYVEGRRLVVDQVGLGISPVERWHFCDQCGNMERVSEQRTRQEECPQCGSRNWADASLTHDLVRLRQVVSTVIDRKSRAQDQRDEREREFFNRHESVLDSENTTREAFKVKGAAIPFGFEFVQKVTFRVVNLGGEEDGAQSFRLGGRQVSTNGFILCPDCGKVQTKKNTRDGEPLRHDISCRHYRKPETAPMKAVFLYREVTSEAIRLLLPSSGPSENVQMASFVAALHLGLRLHFRGSIDHLKSVVDERPVENSNMRRKFLVIYDQVPGGTGYLKQLSQSPQSLLNVLRKAVEHLRQCECGNRQDHSTDGCHRCILHAPQRRDHSVLSRTEAIRLLDAILENAEDIERIRRIADIDIHPLIQSELERNFLDGLRGLPGAELQGCIVEGRPGFLWRHGETAWKIVPQVPIGPEKGVESPSIPDFVLYPVRKGASRPIAVFLDGFAFHADEASGNNRIARDMQQRQALLKSGKFQVWSFSWEDIQYRNDPDKISAAPFGETHAQRRSQLAREVFESDKLNQCLRAGERSSWALFLDYLENPDPSFWKTLSYLYALALPEQIARIDLGASARVIDELVRHQAVSGTLEGKETDGVGGLIADGDGCLTGAAIATSEGIQTRSPDRAFLLLGFDDHTAVESEHFPKIWRGLLRLLNRIQFLPWLRLTTNRGYRNGLFTGIYEDYQQFLSADGPTGPSPDTEADPREPETGADADLEFATPVLHDLLRRIRDNNHPFPEIGFELEVNGQIIATAEAAWSDRKLALIENTCQDDTVAFQNAGWKVLSFSTSEVPTSTILATLETTS